MASTLVQPCLLDRTGSFFKLIDTFASEIGELKQEMVQTVLSDRDPDNSDMQGIEEDLSSLYLQDSTGSARDSGYDSLKRKISILDRLIKTHPVWLLLQLNDEEAMRILKHQPPGIFLVRKSTKLQKKVISLRLDSELGPPVKDFPVKESQYTFSVEGSGISFADLFRLVAFYCISRDVLPFTLRLPEAIAAAKTQTDLEEVAQMGVEVHRQEGTSGGSLKRPKTRDPAPSSKTRSPPPRPPPPKTQRKPPVKQVSMPETVSWVRKQDEDHAMGSKLNTSKKNSMPIPPPRVKKQLSMTDMERRRNTALDDQIIQEALTRSLAKCPRLGTSPSTNSPPPSQDAGQERQSKNGRQRLSDMSISTSSSDSLDFDRSFALPDGPSGAGDSSLEEEYGAESDQDISPPPLKTKKRHGTTFVLPRALKGHLRKVSGVFNSFMTPEKRMVRKIAELSKDKRTYFGCLVQDYISFLQENKGCHVSGLDMLQTIRQFMTQVKSYLAQSSELDPPIESLIPEEEIDVVLEKAMHKCILKPLKSHIEASMKDFQITSGSWKQLRENLALVKQKKPQDLGVDAAAPDSVVIEKIRHKFDNMRKMYSPEKKVTLLLRVCKLIYTVMEDSSGRMYGADDFLPMLTYVLAQCDMPELDTEIEYMMELLDPSLLHGEGGYYLTSAYGAMSLIKNFQEEQAARILSSETRNTLHQWHRRRTTQRIAPSVDDFQNYLRVAFHEVNSGCTAKTLMVRPYSTTEEVCQLCAEKFKVQDPENYTLFLITEETSQQLALDTYPQKIKAEIHSRPNSQPFHFVYKRPTNLNICLPSDEENGNCLPN